MPCPTNSRHGSEGNLYWRGFSRPAEEKPRLFEGFADGGERQSPAPRRGAAHAASHQLLLDQVRQRIRSGHPAILRLDTAARKNELSGHELKTVVPLAHQHLWHIASVIEQDHRRGMSRTNVGGGTVTIDLRQVGRETLLPALRDGLLLVGGAGNVCRCAHTVRDPEVLPSGP